MNIVWICTDQQRRDSMGCYGNPVVETPRLDGLASGGLRFTRSYVANPICMPNRMSMFTGCYPRNHGIWTNGLFGSPHLPLLSRILADAGYAAASVGKLHFMPYGGGDRGWESAERWKKMGCDFDWRGSYGGFGHVELSIGHTQALAHYGKWFYERGGTDSMLIRGADETRAIPPELHDSVWVGECSADFIRKHRQSGAGKPFFLFAGFPDPHHPFDPPRSLAEKYRSRPMPPPVGGPEDLETRPPHYRQHFQGAWHRSGMVPAEHPHGPGADVIHSRRANTCAMIELIDRGVGMILDALDDSHFTEDTLVIFSSDHGELLGDHGLWYKGPFFYEGLIGIPLIIRGPGVRPGVSSALVSTVDMAPTLLEAAGIPVPVYMDGCSIFRHLKDPNVATRTHCLIEYRNGYNADVASAAVVTDTLKYIRYENGEHELTDLTNDPLERCNAADLPQYGRQRREMSDLLLDTLLATGARFPEQIAHA